MRATVVKATAVLPEEMFPYHDRIRTGVTEEMEKRRLFLVFAILFLFSYELIPPPKTHSQTSRAPRPPTQDDRQLIESFRPAKELLTRKGVPFDPEMLLDANWQKTLPKLLSTLPEMHDVRRGSEKIEGVQMANILYLPEQVTLTGDTVFLANQIIFEGRNAVIKGNHNVYFFPVVNEGVLGTTLESAMKEQHDVYTPVRYSSTGRIKEFVPELLQQKWSITIDTSGFGHTEWLEVQKKKRSMRNSKGLLTEDQDTSGLPGSTGAEGPPGLNGTDAMPRTAPNGPPGSCSASHPDGGNGISGDVGGNGSKPEMTGWIGGRGGDAREIITTINNSTGTHQFLAKGGDGGMGGKGGIGGTGGLGADGGNGGPGRDCDCFQGGSGNGGTGGDGGKGGMGGNGGDGGPGGPPGDGKNIRVTVPADFSGTIIGDTAGGRGGTGGHGGDPGFPGQGGQGGNHGSGSTRFNCPASDPANGNPGLYTGNLGFGNTGRWGEDRQETRGQTGELNVITSGGGGGGGCLSGRATNGAKLDMNPTDLCSPCDPSPFELQECSMNNGNYDWSACFCDLDVSPILVDVLGNGFDLTGASMGVSFDIDGDGDTGGLSWTASNSDDSWLALDRNGSGIIENGTELFGNFTNQPIPPPGENRNGFLALGVFDQPANGGNGNGVIDSLDSVFNDLRLWRDSSHNGISEPNELKTLTESGLSRIDLDHKESKRTDHYGNRFKYRSKVWDIHEAQFGRWAWDVYLVRLGVEN